MNGQSLTFQPSSYSVAFSVLLVAGTVVLSWISWQRRGYTAGHGLLELIRVALVLLVAITLNQPELLSDFIPEEEPTIAVLWDDSSSMDTSDVIDEEQPAAAPETRKQWVEPYLENDAIWKPVTSRFNVVFEAFSSTSGTAYGRDKYLSGVGWDFG